MFLPKYLLHWTPTLNFFIILKRDYVFYPFPYRLNVSFPYLYFFVEGESHVLSKVLLERFLCTFLPLSEDPFLPAHFPGRNKPYETAQS